MSEGINREIEKALKAPFGIEDIEWRIQSSGIKDNKPWALVLAYVAARAVQERLDMVVGIENWASTYEHIQNGVICNLSLRINGEWINKQDGSRETEIESFKGGISKAFVRAASAGWGIGRYLYNLDTGWANFTDNGKYRDKIKGQDNKEHYYKWSPPDLPVWALPERTPIKKQSLPVVQPNPDDIRTIPVKTTTGLGKITEQEKADFLAKVEKMKKNCPPDDWQRLIEDFGDPDKIDTAENAAMFKNMLSGYANSWLAKQKGEIPF